MTESNTQAVAQEAEAQATPAPEATSAQDTTPSLDALLQEFETTAKPAPAPVAAPAENPEVAELKREFAEMKFQLEIEPIVKEVRLAGDIAPEISDKLLTKFLDAIAADDPKIARAWQIRRESPQVWERAKKEVVKTIGLFKKSASAVDANATADTNAVAAALKGTSTKAPQEKPPDYGSMDN